MELDASDSKVLVGVSVFCVCVLVRLSFLWEQREWPIGLSDQCPCLREERSEKTGKNNGALLLYAGLVSHVLEEMGFLKLTSRNSKNIVS